MPPVERGLLWPSPEVVVVCLFFFLLRVISGAGLLGDGIIYSDLLPPVVFIGRISFCIDGRMGWDGVMRFVEDGMGWEFVFIVWDVGP